VSYKEVDSRNGSRTASRFLSARSLKSTISANEPVSLCFKERGSEGEDLRTKARVNSRLLIVSGITSIGRNGRGETGLWGRLLLLRVEARGTGQRVQPFLKAGAGKCPGRSRVRTSLTKDSAAHLLVCRSFLPIGTSFATCAF
jgi:hypothetical protein